MDSGQTSLEQYLWQIGLLDAQRQAVLDAARFAVPDGQPDGTVVTFDPATYSLQIAQLGAPEHGRTIALPHPGGTAFTSLSHEAPGIALFGADHRKIGDFAVDDSLGLLITGDRCYRYAAGFRHAHHLASTSQAICPQLGQAGHGFGPVDLHLAPTNAELLIVDRGLGVMQHIDLATGDLGERFTLRPKGGTSLLNTAWNRHRILATDSRNLGLIVCDLVTGESWQSGLQLGTIGNLIVSPDGVALYVLSLAPTFMLHVLDPDTFEPLRQFPLKGKPFSSIGEPTDLMMLSPDGGHLLVMSYVDVPVRHTPVLNVVDLAGNQISQRYRLNPERKPIGLAFGLKNPYYTPPVTVEAALVATGLLSAELIEEASRRLQQQQRDGIISGEDMALRPTLEALSGGYTWRRATVEMANHIHLPLSVEGLLKDYLAHRFTEQTGGKIGADEAILARLEKAAAHVRGELESCLGVEVALRDLMPGKHLKAFVSREMILEWLPILEHDDMLKGVHVQTVPDLCPDCRTPLFGVYLCPACGFEVLVYTRGLLDPSSLSAATMHPGAFLPQNHLLIPDPLRNRLIQLDTDRAIFWELSADSLHQELANLLRWPADCFRLPNRHTLVADAATGRVFEVTRLGRPYWEWPHEAGKLLEPVRIARSEWGDTYVADRKAHRIWRIDSLGAPLTGYGTGEPGRSDGELYQPGDVQVLPDGNMLIADTGNNRVIEVCEGFIVWSVGQDPALRLLNPRRAFRFDNHLTLIVDSGHHRLIAVNREGEIVWTHDTAVGEGTVAMARPLGLVSMSEGRFVYWDTDWIIEIDSQGHLLWTASFAGLTSAASLQRVSSERDAFSRNMPRRLWHVQHLADDDPAELAVRSASAHRRRTAKKLRETAWADRQAAIIAMLRAESRRRLAEHREAAKRRGLKLAPAPAAHAPAREALPARGRLAPALIEPMLAPVIILPSLVPKHDSRMDRQATHVVTVQRNSDQIIWFVRGEGVRWAWGEGVLKRPR
ncbi:MAG: hypothetical protein H7338_21070, partial [Candidatus Sericytochromatia bacterium]|nr:hypothetical protein [Candidatus Sericytochromatia bacterium]